MEKALLFAAVILVSSGCDLSARTGNGEAYSGQQKIENTAAGNDDQTPAPSADLLTLTGAEKILGEPGHLKDSTTTVNEKETTYLCSFLANSKDPTTGKTGVIYFLLETYPQVSAAKEKYSFIKKANEHNGIKVLQDLGDEAYFHSDNENFYFVMVRKGTRVFNMKVNKITSHTSLEEFNRIAKEITDAL